jgi:hypothetical protein
MLVESRAIMHGSVRSRSANRSDDWSVCTCSGVRLTCHTDQAFKLIFAEKTAETPMDTAITPRRRRSGG